MRDLRYLTAYNSTESSGHTTFARRFSARYTHATAGQDQVGAGV